MCAAPGPVASRLAGARALFARAHFRNYFFSSAMFALGIWAFMTAMGWTALQLRDSAFAVSITNVVYFLPMFLLALPMGVIADRWDRRRLAIATRGSTGVLMVAMTALAATDRLTYPLLLVFSFLVGASVVAELPARQAYVAQLVEPSLVMHAAALTEVQGGIARLVGPIAAGWLIDVFGGGGGFGLFAATSFLFVWFFWRIRIPGTVPRTGDVRAPLHEMAEGFRYLRGHDDARAVVLLSVLTGVVGWVYLALMPLVARDVLHGGSVTYGALGMAVGLGSVPGSVTLALTRDFSAQGKAYIGAMVLWGASVVLFSLSRWFPLSLLALGLAGLGFGGQIILVRSILLRIVDPAFHGRVFGTLMLTWGANIVGTLTAGALAERLGVATVVGVSGVAIVVVTLAVLASNPRLLRL